MTDASGFDPPEWTYWTGEQPYGPFTRGQLAEAAHLGYLPPGMPVYNHRLQSWHPAATLVAYHPSAMAPPHTSDDPTLRYLLPVGRSGWSIAAGYLGLMAWLIFPLAPFALITAELGRREIAADPTKLGSGRVMLGYAGGVVGMALLIFVLIGFATAP